MSFGYPLRHLRTCPSTNALARELAGGGAPHGSVVTTGMQTAGRGRQGREWLTGRPGSMLAYSAVYRDERLPPLLPITAAIATCEAIRSLAPVQPMAKWPNDVWLQGRKCAGILVEARPLHGWAVIGIGINLTVQPGELPAELRDTATSIGHGVGISAARDAVTASLGAWLQRREEEVLEAFAEVDALHGSQVRWEQGSGIAKGIDRSGNLLVRERQGAMTALSAGEVHLTEVGEAATAGS